MRQQFRPIPYTPLEKEALKVIDARNAEFNMDADTSDKAMVLADVADLGKALAAEGAAVDLIEAHRSLYKACSASASPDKEAVPCRGKKISYASVCASLERRGFAPRLGACDFGF